MTTPAGTRLGTRWRPRSRLGRQAVTLGGLSLAGIVLLLSEIALGKF